MQICKKQKKKEKKKKANKQTEAKKNKNNKKTKKTSKLATITDLHSAVCKMDGSAGESKRSVISLASNTFSVVYTRGWVIMEGAFS